MAEAGGAAGGPGGRDVAGGADREHLASELDELGPFIDLAREIKRDVDRIAADPGGDVDQLVDAIAEIPRTERRRAVEAVFDRLTPDAQWAVLERAFGGDEIREHLDRRRAQLLAAASAGAERQAVAAQARAARVLDTRLVPAGDEVVLGLFREADVRSATTRGRASATCARALVLRAEAPPRLRVIEDVFNPRGGLFVTRDYDESVWQADRFVAHTVVTVGAANDGPDGPVFEPLIYLGGRADFRTDEGTRRGHLHVGFVMLGDIDVFAA